MSTSHAAPRVLIADAVDASCDAVFAERGIACDRAVGVPIGELYERVANYDAIIVRSAVQVDRAMIERMPGMRVIGRAGAGVDNIDVDAAGEHGIQVMNTPGGNTISATEHTIALLFAVLRKIPAANTSLRSGSWDRKFFTGTELMGKRVGVLGLGRIGREVAARLAPFGTTVRGYDPFVAAEQIRELGVEPATFEELITTSDILTIHIPLTNETRGLIGADELARMPRGAFVLNCSRGGIVDEAALLAALDSGQIAGAGIDVFEPEPPPFPNALIEHPRVVATPHIAASTNEAQRRVAVEIAHQVADFLSSPRA